MATARRVFWESVIFVAFLAAGAGLFLWSEWRVASESEALRLRHEQALAARDEQHRSEFRELTSAADRRVQARAEEQARAVFRAFEAGAHAAIVARWTNYLDTASRSLSSEPAILFVHILTPQGRTITASDGSETSTKRLEQRGDWVISTRELASRTGESDGVLELAAPVREAGRTVAFLWLGYDLSSAAGTVPGAG